MNLPLPIGEPLIHTNRYCKYRPNKDCLMGRHYKCEKCEQPMLYYVRLIDERTDEKIREYMRHMDERMKKLENMCERRTYH